MPNSLEILCPRIALSSRRLRQPGGRATTGDEDAGQESSTAVRGGVTVHASVAENCPQRALPPPRPRARPAPDRYNEELKGVPLGRRGRQKDAELTVSEWRFTTGAPEETFWTR
jgi:hypothetical protein